MNSEKKEATSRLTKKMLDVCNDQSLEIILGSIASTLTNVLMSVVNDPEVRLEMAQDLINLVSPVLSEEVTPETIMERVSVTDNNYLKMLDLLNKLKGNA